MHRSSGCRLDSSASCLLHLESDLPAKSNAEISSAFAHRCCDSLPWIDNTQPCHDCELLARKIPANSIRKIVCQGEFYRLSLHLPSRRSRAISEWHGLKDFVVE